MSNLTKDTQNTTADFSDSPLPPQSRLALTLQRFLGWMLLIPLGFLIVFLLRVRFGLKVKNHREIRRQFKEIVKQKRPILICPNHLTMVDSVVVLWALASIPYYLLHYRLFCWNIPAIENYADKPTWRIITYLSKCIPIDRAGSAEHIDSILDKIASLLVGGDLCMVFPEGTRSRTGRINSETAAYGIGKIIRKVPNCAVLCIYARGEKQETYSIFPHPRDTIHIEMELITPSSNAKGLRAIRDYSVQTIGKLKELEDRFFALKEGSEATSNILVFPTRNN